MLLFTELHLSQNEWDAIDLWMDQLDYDEDNAEDRLKKPFASLLWHEDMVPILEHGIPQGLWNDAIGSGELEYHLESHDYEFDDLKDAEGECLI